MNQDRYRGALLGLACGDALGTTLEFKKPGTFEPITDMNGGGPFDLQAGQWTDDTSMALCLAESLIECQEFNALDQMERYVRWFKDGHLSSTGSCFDIGNTTKRALYEFLTSGNPLAGSTDERAAGNGSIMRLAPVPLAFAQDLARAMEMSAQSSRTTHGADVCVDACRYLAALIVDAVSGVAKEDLLSRKCSSLCTPIAEIAAGSFKRKEPPAIRGTGFVVDSLEAALWAFNRTNTYSQGALLAVNLGDDADTTGAVYGQLAGAYYGAQNIPESWLKKLVMRQKIESSADGLLKLALA